MKSFGLVVSVPYVGGALLSLGSRIHTQIADLGMLRSEAN